MRAGHRHYLDSIATQSFTGGLYSAGRSIDWVVIARAGSLAAVGWAVLAVIGWAMVKALQYAAMIWGLW